MVSVMPSRSCIEFTNKQRNFCKETKLQEYLLAMDRRRVASKSDKNRLNRKLPRDYI